MPKLEFQLELIGLYGGFIERKYDIYQEEKFRVQVNNVVAKEQRERDVKCMREDHQLLALKVLFTEEQVTLIQNNRECTFSPAQLTSFGIVQVSHDGKLHFIHRTFAEYYVADCLVNLLTEGNNTSEQVMNFILKVVFQKKDYQVVRVFIDGFLTVSKISEKVLKEYGNQIHGLLKGSELEEDGDDDDEHNDYVDHDVHDDCLHDCLGDSLPFLHRAVREGNANIIGLLLDSAQAAENTDTLNKLLLEQDEEGRTAWHQTVYSHNIHVSEKLWECAKRNQGAHDLRNEMLLAKDRRNMNAWHLALDEGKVELLLKQWEIVKENLTTQEVKEILLDTDSKRRTIFHLAGEFFELELFKGLLNWAKENITKEDIIEMLIATDNEGRTVFRVGAEFGELQEFRGTLNWAKNNLTKDYVIKLLLDSDNKGRTVFHVAAELRHLDLYQGIVNWAKENLTREEVNKLLLATDNEGRTVFHVAAELRDLEVFQGILNWANNNLTRAEEEDEQEKKLFAIDNEGENFGELQEFQGKFNWAKKKPTRELVIKMLLARDYEGRTVFHVTAKFFNLELFQGILNWAKENLTRDYVNKFY
jgi:ankyrin repeat protein